MSQGIVLSPILEANLTPPDYTPRKKRTLEQVSLSQQIVRELLSPRLKRARTEFHLEIVMKPSDGLSPSERKLWRTFKKGLKEHGVDFDSIPHAELARFSQPLKMHISTAEAQSLRADMEDAHFTLSFPHGDLFGVFDGHGDKGAISQQAAQAFQERFPARYQENPSDIEAILKDLCEEIHNEITQESGGTTVLICFRERVTGRVYTATLGDSEAMIFRKGEDGTIHCIPLSCVRNWKSEKDQGHAELAIDDPVIFQQWLAGNPSKRYFPPPDIDENGKPKPGIRVNVSRSLGDKSVQFRGRTAISHTPRTTMTQIRPNDLLVLGCDGLWDFVDRQLLIDEVIAPNWDNPEIAQLMVNYARSKHTQRSCDNVTVLCAWAKPPGVELPVPEATPATQPL